MFKDSTGAVSSTRVCMVLIVASVMLVFILHNIISMAHHGGFVSMGTAEVSALGLALATKVAQNFTEKDDTTPPVEGPGK